jgi:hypothetical protein
MIDKYLLLLVPFRGLNEDIATEDELEKLSQTVDYVLDNVNFSNLEKEDLSFLIDYFSVTDSLYDMNTLIADEMVLSDFTNFNESLLLMRLPEYALQLKRKAIEQGVFFTTSAFYPNNLSPYNSTELFVQKINWKISPNFNELNFLFFLIEDSLNGHFDISISEKTVLDLSSKVKDLVDFNEISYDYERMGALKLILKHVQLDPDEQERPWSSKISVYNGLFFLKKDNYKDKLEIFKNKNNIIIITDNIERFDEKRAFLQSLNSNYFYDQNREIIKDNPFVQ